MRGGCLTSEPVLGADSTGEELGSRRLCPNSTFFKPQVALLSGTSWLIWH